MGFWSSITKPFKKVFNTVKDVVGDVVDFVSPVLGPVGDVVGGFLGSNSNEAANEANIALAREQIAYQKELAQNQMQWRVEDAKKAGMHPMAALGLSSMSYSPVSANVMPTDYSYLGDMGQNINRAIMQGKTARERQQALDRQDQFDMIALRKANADADYAETLAASERLKLQRELFPPTPSVDGDRTLIGGQNDSTVGNSFSSGTTPLLSLSRVGNTLMGHINPDISDSLTEDMIRNQIANFNAEIQSGRITPEVYSHLTSKERELIKKGDLVLEYSFPSSWRLRYTPRMRPKYSNENREVGGRLNFYHMKY